MEEKTASQDVRSALQPDPEANVPEEDVSSQSRPWKHYSFYLSILMLAVIGLIVSWDATALSLALSSIAQQLGGTTFQSFWANIAFILGVAVSQPIYASVSDVVGRKSALYTSVVLFVVGSIVFATAKNMSVIVVGRLIKGIGAGGLDVLQTIILCDITTLKERPRWLGVMSMANALGSVTGPFVGSVFAERVGWQWLGWINLVTGGVTGVLAFFFLHLTPIEGGIKDKVRRLDWPGFALFTVISTTVALPLSWADSLYGWASWQTLVPLIVGIVLLVPFGFLEKRAAVPMIPYPIFDNVSIITGTMSGFLYGALLNPIFQYIPLFFQAVYLETPIEAARSTLPLCCFLVAASITVSMLIEWSRKYRIASWVGWVLATVFLGLYYIIGADANRAKAYAFQALLGVGLGTAMVSTMIAVLASVKRVDHEGLAAGMLVTARFLGSLLGLAICATVFSSSFQKAFSSVQNLPQELAVLKDGSQAVAFIPQLRKLTVSEDVMQSVTGAYAHAFQTVWAVLTAFSGMAAILSLLTREKSLEKNDLGRQGFQAPPSK